MFAVMRELVSECTRNSIYCISGVGQCITKHHTECVAIYVYHACENRKNANENVMLSLRKFINKGFYMIYRISFLTLIADCKT